MTGIDDGVEPLFLNFSTIENRNLRRQWQESRSPSAKSRIDQCQNILRISFINQEE